MDDNEETQSLGPEWMSKKNEFNSTKVKTQVVNNNDSPSPTVKLSTSPTYNTNSSSPTVKLSSSPTYNTNSPSPTVKLSTSPTSTNALPKLTLPALKKSQIPHMKAMRSNSSPGLMDNKSKFNFINQNHSPTQSRLQPQRQANDAVVKKTYSFNEEFPTLQTNTTSKNEKNLPSAWNSGKPVEVLASKVETPNNQKNPKFDMLPPNIKILKRPPFPTKAKSEGNLMPFVPRSSKTQVSPKNSKHNLLQNIVTPNPIVIQNTDDDRDSFFQLLNNKSVVDVAESEEEIEKKKKKILPKITTLKILKFHPKTLKFKSKAKRKKFWKHQSNLKFRKHRIVQKEAKTNQKKK